MQPGLSHIRKDFEPIMTFLDRKDSTDMIENEKQAAQQVMSTGANGYNATVERKLRLKIDLYVVPTVALLYLMCFIDRANIGKRFPILRVWNARTQFHRVDNHQEMLVLPASRQT